MPKRRNSFGDLSPLQFKTHISRKEIDMGVRQAELMKDVYVKTQEMLFSGARKTASMDMNDNHLIWAPEMALPCTECPYEPRQMCLDRSGHLTLPIHCKNLVFPKAKDVKHPQQSYLMEPPGSLSSQMHIDSHGQLTAPMECDIQMNERSIRSFPIFGQDAMPLKPSAYELAFGGCNTDAVLHRDRSGFEFNRKKHDTDKSQMCVTCRQVASVGEIVKCYFCERQTCRGCHRQCDLCANDFCQLCTTVNYDKAVERSFCLTCV